MNFINKNPLPFFSVIMCTYNRAGLIQKALDSLDAQTFSEWELIVVDDGSTDNTDAIVRDFISLHPSAVYLYHSNIGPGLSKNQGMRLAKGSYITFLDSDDEYAPDHLALRRRILSDQPDIDFLYGKVQVIGDPYVPDMENPGRMIHLDECKIGGTFFIRRDKLTLPGGFDKRYFGDDTLFFQNVIKAGLKMIEVTERTYIYHRDYYDSICKQIEIYGDYDKDRKL